MAYPYVADDSSKRPLSTRLPKDSSPSLSANISATYKNYKTPETCIFRVFFLKFVFDFLRTVVTNKRRVWANKNWKKKSMKGTSARDDEWNRNIESNVGKVGSWFSSVYQKDYRLKSGGGIGSDSKQTFRIALNLDNVFVLPFSTILDGNWENFTSCLTRTNNLRYYIFCFPPRKRSAIVFLNLIKMFEGKNGRVGGDLKKETH